MTVYRFQEIKRKKQVKFTCQSCEKKRVKTLSVCHTVNPFNKNEDGSVKTPSQVAESVEKKLKELVKNGKAPAPFVIHAIKNHNRSELMKEFNITERFSFTGNFKVKAENREEAMQKVKDNCAMVGGNIHSSLSEKEIDWDFPVHPDRDTLFIS